MITLTVKPGTATYPLRIPAALKIAAESAARADRRSLNNWILMLIEREVGTVTETMTYSELLESMYAQGYEIIATGGITETVEQHLQDLEADPSATYGESENTGCLLVYVEGQAPVKVYTREGYARWLRSQDQDVDAEMERLGL